MANPTMTLHISCTSYNTKNATDNMLAKSHNHWRWDSADISCRLQITKSLAPSTNISDLARVAMASTTLVSNHYTLSSPNKVIVSNKLNRSSKILKNCGWTDSNVCSPKDWTGLMIPESGTESRSILNTSVCTLSMTHQTFDQSSCLTSNNVNWQYTFVLPSKSIGIKWPSSPIKWRNRLHTSRDQS